MNERESNGQKLFWHRASIDGAPFRAPENAPLLREEEFEQKVKRVGDSFVRVFDMADAQQQKDYQEILDRIVNGRGQVIHVDRQFDEKKGTWVVYIEWAEYFMELPEQQMLHGQQSEQPTQLDPDQPDPDQVPRTGPTNEQYQPPAYIPTVPPIG
jgi:hypothetical protein